MLLIRDRSLGRDATMAVASVGNMTTCLSRDAPLEGRGVGLTWGTGRARVDEEMRWATTPDSQPTLFVFFFF